MKILLLLVTLLLQGCMTPLVLVGTIAGLGMMKNEVGPFGPKDTPKKVTTDRGDDEGGFEWAEGRISGCRDRSGDDDVEIVLPHSGPPQVDYRLASSGC